MAQHDMNIANQGFPATRADLNNALQALVSNSSGTSAPSTTFANQWWYDTTNNKMYLRNEANNAWIEVFTLDQTNNEWQLTTGVVQAKDSDGLALKTDDGTTRLFVKDSDGFISVGHASPLSGLHISDGTNAGSPQNASRAATLMIDAGATASADLQFMVRNGYNSHIFFGDAADPNIGMLYYDHTNNDMAFNVNAGEKVRFISEGGITFNGDTAAANALDDYEEGSWTPAIFYQNSTDNSNATETVQQGKYVKIGQLVYVSFRLDWTQNSGSPANDNIGIDGLPFAGVNNHYNGGGGMITSSSEVGLNFQVPQASSFRLIVTNSANVGNFGNEFGSGSNKYIRGTCTYLTSS